MGLVQGQGSIAKAFRIGANLVLTKPIHAEQSTAHGSRFVAQRLATNDRRGDSFSGRSEEATLNAVAAFSALH